MTRNNDAKRPRAARLARIVRAPSRPRHEDVQRRTHQKMSVLGQPPAIGAVGKRRLDERRGMGILPMRPIPIPWQPVRRRHEPSALNYAAMNAIRRHVVRLVEEPETLPLQQDVPQVLGRENQLICAAYGISRINREEAPYVRRDGDA